MAAYNGGNYYDVGRVPPLASEARRFCWKINKELFYTAQLRRNRDEGCGYAALSCFSASSASADDRPVTQFSCFFNKKLKNCVTGVTGGSGVY